MPKVTKAEFCWTDDDIQLLFELVNHNDKCNAEFKCT